MKKILDSTTLLALITAILYCWSTAYYNGFLITAGLNQAMMERSFHQMLYTGLLISFFPVIYILFITTFIYFFYSRTIIPEYVSYCRKGFRQKRNIIKMKIWFYGKKKDSPLEIKEKLRSNHLSVLLILGIFFLFSLYYFELQGSAKANVFLNAYSEEEHEKYTEVEFVSNNATKYRLVFLACGSKNCAGLEKETNRVFYFPQSVGYSFVFNKEKHQ